MIPVRDLLSVLFFGPSHRLFLSLVKTCFRSRPSLPRLAFDFDLWADLPTCAVPFAVLFAGDASTFFSFASPAFETFPWGASHSLLVMREGVP